MCCVRLTLIPARKAGTRYTYSGGIEGWVDRRHYLCCNIARPQSICDSFIFMHRRLQINSIRPTYLFDSHLRHCCWLMLLLCLVRDIRKPCRVSAGLQTTPPCLHVWMKERWRYGTSIKACSSHVFPPSDRHLHCVIVLNDVTNLRFRNICRLYSTVYVSFIISLSYFVRACK